MNDHTCSACGGRGVKELGYPNLRPPLCRVCLGSGRISDSTPIADAIADAETLRLFYRGLASILTPSEIEHIRSGDMWAVNHTSRAARAAFLVVPALRGDR